LSAAGGAVTRGARFPALVAFALLAAGSIEAGRLALNKYFSIDEFMHAHASWLTGRGFLPYRDFCDFHFPFLYQLLGGLWLLMSDDPGNVLFLRLAMLGLVFVIALAAFTVNRREGFVAALAAPAVLLTITPFAIRATEIRHDTLAFACFLSGASRRAFAERRRAFSSRLPRGAPRRRSFTACPLECFSWWKRCDIGGAALPRSGRSEPHGPAAERSEPSPPSTSQ
jgi:hypothetical protein